MILTHYLAEITEGYVGAEIEQIVISGLFEAFSEDRSIDIGDFRKIHKKYSSFISNPSGTRSGQFVNGLTYVPSQPHLPMIGLIIIRKWQDQN